MSHQQLLEEAEQALGLKFFDHQLEAFGKAAMLHGSRPRLCHYYPTGKGKTITTLVTMLIWEEVDVLVIAPPATEPAWKATAGKLGMTVTVISHTKFRQKTFQLSRTQPIIVDEFHLLGGHTGQGWKKMERLAPALQAPLLLASATPNYNDADRVYCIQRILDPGSCAGGYLQFLYQHCITAQNPFGMIPNVLGFQRYASAADYLADLPHVLYLPDELNYQIVDYPVPVSYPASLLQFGYNERRHRLLASQMEERHTLIFQGLVGRDGRIWPHVYDQLSYLVGQAATPVLLYCNRATVAEALFESLKDHGANAMLVTGKTSARAKAEIIQRFRDGKLDLLVGTATLATGTDGLDKVSDVLIIVDDTDDDSLRRQLIGRIMPRGAATDVGRKQVYRLVLDSP